MRLQSFTLILLTAATLGACVSIDRQTAVSIKPVDGKTRIDVKVPNREMEFNWHGGGWHNLSDQFTIEVPRGATLVTGSEVRLSAGSDKKLLPVSERSTVSIRWSPDCAVHIQLYDGNGRPYAINGQRPVHEFLCVR